MLHFVGEWDGLTRGYEDKYGWQGDIATNGVGTKSFICHTAIICVTSIFIADFPGFNGTTAGSEDFVVEKFLWILHFLASTGENDEEYEQICSKSTTSYM